ncbi:MAG: T9SS type A sorting domain-containing protein [Bacteroidales bacterium]|nr:T9SS type A sorting domain-containing protein [Bacteroidales bacterium]
MRTFLLIPLIFLTYWSFSQVKSVKPKEFKKLTYLGTTSPLKNIIPLTEKMGDVNKPGFNHNEQTNILSGKIQTDPVKQSEFFSNDSIPVLVNFAGVGSVNMPNPDTEGDVGPNHYFQMVKNSFAIWDKSGNILYGPAENKTIWSEFPGPWHDQGWTDPIVLYDHLNDRWLASVMIYEIDIEYHILIAVSATPDPLGEWHCYALWFDVMPDYPKFGVWPDGYYLTINEYSIVGYWGTFERAGILVFNPEELINGATDPTVIYFYFDSPNNSFTTDIASFQPSDLDGYPPPEGTPNYHICVKDDIWGYEQDRLWIWECVVDWSDTSNCHFSEVTILETEPFDSNYDNMAYIHQPGTSTRLHSLSQFMMYRLQYRNFGEYQTLVCNHTVEVNGNEHAGVRWYELRNEGAGWYIYQQSSLAPDEDSRWMGSIAMDADGNIGLGYSVSGDMTFPSIRITGRRQYDAPGIMTLNETEIMAGSGNQSYNVRWGDYSTMSVDPVDDLTFWYTQEYLPVFGPLVWQTRIASFQLHKNMTFSEDSLVYMTIEDCLTGKTLVLQNESQFDIEIQNIEQEGYIGGALWYIDPFNINFPFQLVKGDSITLQLFIELPVGESINGFLSDTLNIETDYKQYNIPILLNDELITKINRYNTESKKIFQIYPNPFDNTIQIQVSLLQESRLKLEICDISERTIKVLISSGLIQAGNHLTSWNGTDGRGVEVENGIYFCKATINNKVFIEKIIKQ